MTEEEIREEADEFTLTPENYAADGHAKTFGTENPSIMRKPFWKYMVHTMMDAYGARSELNAPTVFPNTPPWNQMAGREDTEDTEDTRDEDDLGESDDLGEVDTLGDIKPKTGPKVECPIWCFDRFGQTTTELPDGRVVYIAGEHEDFYDPDFCIYNDIVVVDTTIDHPTPKAITIYGYPLEVFPPTDAHTATLYLEPETGKQYIYIIGGTGYPDGPHRAETNVYRLNLADFSIQKMETSGAKPEGQLDHHLAELLDGEDGSKSVIKITTSTWARNNNISDSPDDDQDDDEDEQDENLDEAESSDGHGSETSTDTGMSSDNENLDDHDSDESGSEKATALGDNESLDHNEAGEIAALLDAMTPVTPAIDEDDGDNDTEGAESFVEKVYHLHLQTLTWRSVES